MVAKAGGGSPVKGVPKNPDTEIGWVTEAKDWAGELISGQTTTGRILVSVFIVLKRKICPAVFFFKFNKFGNCLLLGDG